MVHCATMHHHNHPYGVQTAAFFIALLPFVVLFVMMIAARVATNRALLPTVD